VGDCERVVVRRHRGQRRSVLEHAEEVRLLEDHARRVLRRLPELVRIGRAVAVRNLDDLEAEPTCVGLHDLSRLRVEGLGEDDLRPPRRVLRDVAGVGRDGGAVVAGRVGDVHAGELTDRGLVLEDRLQDALAHLGLVRRVGREELAACEDGVDDCRHIVVVHARAEERELRAGVDVARRELLEMGDELRFRKRRLERERPAEAHAGRDLLEELVDRRDTDGGQHLVAVARREREVAHCAARCCLYASTSSRSSTSRGSLMRMRTSQPSP
jgi:hypothetical protein